MVTDTKKYDIAVIGGSLGGVLAAYSAASSGKSVYMSEATDWIGGQLTSQAVPPDEHNWIEEFGSTQSYRDFRLKVREYYRGLDTFVKSVSAKDRFCPGNSWVSRISHEPKVALNILKKMLEPFLQAGRIHIEYNMVPISAQLNNDIIKTVTLKSIVTGKQKTISADFFLDATDCGDLLPIVGCEYRSGAESRIVTGEPSAPLEGDPQDVQPITWVAALELTNEKNYTISKPEMYDYFAELEAPYDDNKILSWYAPDALTQKKSLYAMFDNQNSINKLGLWSYRRVIARENYTDLRNDVSLINWPQNDFCCGNVYDTPDWEHNLYMARQQTLSLIYWLQVYAPNPDGGRGYKVKPRGDIMGTSDGLAKAPYIRESRRIQAHTTVREQDVSVDYNQGIIKYQDSVGLGHYAIDVHMTTRSHTFKYGKTYPFEIPLGAMVPVRIKNLIPSCKNIGCTHLTNGCYRLHPVEWNVGEVAGLLAAYCLEHGCFPVDVLNNHIQDFQALIVSKGIQIHWPENMII